MDLRIRKTLLSIKNAYFLLAREKGIDNISVKALCDEAMINKATFYSHYKAIYELNEEFEEEAITELLSAETARINDLKSHDDLLQGIVSSFSGNEKVRLILQSSRRLDFMNHLFEQVKENVLMNNPELNSRKGIEFVLSFVYHGLAYVFADCLETGKDEQLMTEVIGDCIARVLA